MATEQGRPGTTYRAAWPRAQPKMKDSGAKLSVLLKRLCAENSTPDHYRKTSSLRAWKKLHWQLYTVLLPYSERKSRPTIPRTPAVQSCTIARIQL
jgi:hypothetical protein